MKVETARACVWRVASMKLVGYSGKMRLWIQALERRQSVDLCDEVDWVRTCLEFDPWRCGSVPLNYAIHEELLTSNERIMLIRFADKRLSSAFYGFKLPLLSSALERCRGR